MKKTNKFVLLYLFKFIIFLLKKRCNPIQITSQNKDIKAKEYLFCFILQGEEIQSWSSNSYPSNFKQNKQQLP